MFLCMSSSVCARGKVHESVSKVGSLYACIITSYVCVSVAVSQFECRILRRTLSTKACPSYTAKVKLSVVK